MRIQRRPLEAPLRRVNCMIFSLVVRGRKRPSRTLMEFVMRDLMINYISEDLVFNLDEWCYVFYVTKVT